MSPCMPCLMPPTRSLTPARVPCIFQFPATSGCRITTPNRIFGEKGDQEYRDLRQKSILEYPPRPRSLYPIATRRCSRPRHHAGEALCLEPHLLGVDAIHHHAYQRLRARGAQQHATRVIQLGHEFLIGPLHDLGTSQVETRRHAHIDHALRKFAHAHFELVQRTPTAHHLRHHLQRRDDTVTRGRAIEADEVARGFAAEPPAVIAQHLEYVPIAHGRAFELHVQCAQRVFQTEIAHDRAYDRTALRTRLHARFGDDIEQFVAVDHLAFVVHHDHAI